LSNICSNFIIPKACSVDVEEVPQPTPEKDEVLVRVRAASINPLDTAVLAGYLSFMAAPPLTLGTDFAGDVVAVGGEYLERSYNVLKPVGRYVTALMMETPKDEAERRGICNFGLASQPRANYLAKVADLVDAGKLSVVVSRTFPLNDVVEAMDFGLKSKVPNKVVLTVS
jgi:NADPH:quinone reductase-like Zn-dependent oxidoreductase